MDTDLQARYSYTDEYNELMIKIQHIKVTSQNLMLILEYVIEIVEKVENLKGNKKKALAVQLIQRVVLNADMDDNDRALCVIMIDNGIIGDTIDLVINAVNGKLDFASAITTGKKWCMFAFFKILSMRSKKKNKNRSQIQP